MATERKSPDALTTQTNLTGSLTDIDEDPDSADASWLVATGNNVSTTAHVTFPSPTGNPTVGAGLQEFRVQVRKFSSTQTGTPTVTIALYDNGTLISTSSSTNVTSATGQVVSYTWNASTLSTASGAGVECRVNGVATGGSPGARNTVDVGAIEWNVTYDIPPLTTAPSDTEGLSDSGTAKDVTGVATTTLGLTDDVTTQLSGGGGSALTQGVDDNEPLTDAIALDVGLVRTDAEGLTDALALDVGLVRTDSEGLTDVAALDVGLVRTDNEGLTDTTTVSQGFGRQVDDTEGLTDSITTVLAKDVTLTDSEGLTDSLVKDVGLGITDPEGLTDALAKDVGKVLTDNEGLSDTGTALDRSGTKVDPVDLTDSITTVLSKAVTQTDTEGLTDSVTTASTYARTVTDNLGLTDSVSTSLVSGPGILTVTITDNMGTRDSLSKVRGWRTFALYADEVGPLPHRTAMDRVGVRESYTLYKDAGGTWRVGRNLSPTEQDGAQVIYRGGYDNHIEPAHVAELVAAGFSLSLVEEVIP